VGAGTRGVDEVGYCFEMGSGREGGGGVEGCCETFVGRGRVRGGNDGIAGEGRSRAKRGRRGGRGCHCESVMALDERQDRMVFQCFGLI